MIVAHLSELHLGFRAYDRTERGRNVRERDVAGAFERAVQEVVRARPDLVVIAGDVFDRADPTPSGLTALTRGLDALRSALPDTPVVLTAGARDSPLRPGDATALSVVEPMPGVEVATGSPRSVGLHPDLHVSLVPYRAGLREPFPVPGADPRARHNVLVAYGTVESGGGGVPIDPAEWSYVALGGAHGWAQVAPNVAYAGSLERVEAGPWSEAAGEKGFLTVDVDAGRIRFHALPVRPVVSLAPVRTPAEGPGGLPGRVREVTDEIPGGLDEKIVRLRIRGASPDDISVLQGELLADLSRRALHLDVEIETPGDPAELPMADALLRRRLEGDSAAAGRVEALFAEEGAMPLPPPLRRRVAEDDPVLGALDVRLPEGLLAVVSEDAAATRRFLRLVAAPPGEDPPPWRDPRASSLDRAFAAVVDALAAARGVAGLEAAMARLPARAGADDGPDPPGGAESLEELERRLIELEGCGAELRGLERELRDLRADHAEVAGDLEEATMEWLRERQDAETHLQAYRDRARELRTRLSRIEEAGGEAPCPICGRLLGDHIDEVLGDLREEWESVVQDGSWWRRRREQLDPKPADLQELEGRALRLQASVEACSERLEGARSRVRERDEARARVAELRAEAGTDSGGPVGDGAVGPGAGSGGGSAADRAERALADVIREVRGAVRERLLGRASRHAATITGSRVLALTTGGGAATVRLEGILGPLEPGEEDAAAGEVCLRLAGAAMAADEGDGASAALLPVALVERLRLLDLLPSLRGSVPTILVGMHGRTAERRQEAFDGVLELLPAGPDGPSFRWLATGRSRLVLRASSGRGGPG